MTTVEELKEVLDGINIKNIPLCKKPKNMPHNSPKILWGDEMETHEVGVCRDLDAWYFPKGVKIEKDKQYKVWYTYHDAADPADMSCSQHVFYIEEINSEKSQIIKLLKETLKRLQ